MVVKKVSADEAEPLEIEAEVVEVEVLNLAGSIDDESVKADEPLHSEKSAEMQVAFDQSWTELILNTPYDIMAKIYGEHWQLTAGELELMTPPASRIFAELFGRYINTNPDAYMLGFALLAATGARVAETKRKINEQAVKEGEQDNNTNGTYYTVQPTN